MGKKSRRQRHAPRRKAKRDTTIYLRVTPTETPDLPRPPNGWALELQQAQKAAKREETIETLLRLCRALRMMRRWEELWDTTTKVLTGDAAQTSPNEVRTELRKYRSAAESELVYREPRIGLLQLIDENKADASLVASLYDRYFGSRCFRCLNFLQLATVTGDMCLLEHAVAAGAALDCKTGESDIEEAPREPILAQRYTPNCTALVLGCVILATKDRVSEQQPFQEIMDCVCQLVRLGADSQERFELDLSATQGDFLESTIRDLSLRQKTAREIALVAGLDTLVELMDAHADTFFRGNHDKVCSLFHCRCGSRLPWSDCHIGQMPVESLVMILGDDPPLFRLSPLAACPCSSRKSYFACCWECPSCRILQDKTGKTEQFLACYEEDAVFINMMTIMQSLGSSPRSERVADFARYLREGGFEEVGLGLRLRSSISREVYIGIFECLEGSCFMWIDNHWQVEKPVLMNRVKAWNEALEKYCDTMAIHGDEREIFVALHEASPFAPCSSEACNKIEKTVKGFQSCQQCRSVAYCSPACQKQHWKTHKVVCFPH